MKILDRYILAKFLGTFVFTISLVMMIVVVFDASEKLGDFMDRDAPLRAIVFDYYFNFIPFFANFFSPLFVFIAVIFFTSRMASRTEIVAILSSGISFNRIVFVPYFIGASLIALLSLYMNHFVIPNSNKVRLEFEETYIRNQFRNTEHHIHRQISPDTRIYFSNFDAERDIGHMFSIEQFRDGQRTYYLKSEYIQWDSLKQKWSIHNYFIRKTDSLKESIRRGFVLDTVLNFSPSDFKQRLTSIERMNWNELNSFIEEERKKGSMNIDAYEVEKHRRTAFPFATFILVLIGVSIASRKVRGGIGLHIGLGIGIAFTFILFMQVAAQLSIKGGWPPMITLWTPNILFGILAVYLLRKAPK
ncbi:MAG: LptF/LptG family permease [Bacteroidia bacterium]|nr:LptF/LptG family permease [Bacteroidia bacterium]